MVYADDAMHELMDDVTPGSSRQRHALHIGLRQRIAKQITSLIE